MLAAVVGGCRLHQSWYVGGRRREEREERGGREERGERERERWENGKEKILLEKELLEKRGEERRVGREGREGKMSKDIFLQ